MTFATFLPYLEETRALLESGDVSGAKAILECLLDPSEPIYEAWDLEPPPIEEGLVDKLGSKLGDYAGVHTKGGIRKELAKVHDAGQKAIALSNQAHSYNKNKNADTDVSMGNHHLAIKAHQALIGKLDTAHKKALGAGDHDAAAWISHARDVHKMHRNWNMKMARNRRFGTGEAPPVAAAEKTPKANGPVGAHAPAPHQAPASPAAHAPAAPGAAQAPRKTPKTPAAAQPVRHTPVTPTPAIGAGPVTGIQKTLQGLKRGMATGRSSAVNRPGTVDTQTGRRIGQYDTQTGKRIAPAPSPAITTKPITPANHPASPGSKALVKMQKIASKKPKNAASAPAEAIDISYERLLETLELR